jgi:hypothetical protein
MSRGCVGDQVRFLDGTLKIVYNWLEQATLTKGTQNGKQKMSKVQHRKTKHF